MSTMVADEVRLPSVEAFSRTAEALLAAGGDPLARRRALSDQQALWGQVVGDVAAAGTAIPGELREDLLKLAAVVLGDLEEVEPDIALHVTVNRAMRDGLADA
ncbi:flagellar biosynthesis regulator FlaF [Elioraea rosea]|uniref:flagellar biosynthesis regulator FlaF n=1 Tax=Elioraea rosea TaxID=2492390 RepID=UPI0013150CC3|nr:flagellar biosynthesis regulator FlaF [Elioraea rosea]